MFKVNNGVASNLYLKRRVRQLCAGWSLTGGRNVSGKITSFKKGAFKLKRLYRFIDFWRRLTADAFIVQVTADNFRSSTISLVFYQTGFLSYLVLPEGYQVGHKLCFSLRPHLHGREALFPGNAIPLSEVLEGAVVFNVELWPTKGAQLCRAAGTYAVLISRKNGFATLKLRSGWKVVLSELCYAVLGVAPNYKHTYRVLRKAGLRVNLGRRPTVRGVAMNAIDHPHGGGRGKTSGGPRPRSPWGRITKQQKTVSKKLRDLKRLVRFR